MPYYLELSQEQADAFADFLDGISVTKGLYRVFYWLKMSLSTSNFDGFPVMYSVSLSTEEVRTLIQLLSGEQDPRLQKILYILRRISANDPKES